MEIAQNTNMEISKKRGRPRLSDEEKAARAKAKLELRAAKMAAKEEKKKSSPKRKRARTGFNLFVKEQMAGVKKQYLETLPAPKDGEKHKVDNRQILKLTASCWNDLTSEQKSVYNNKAKQEALSVVKEVMHDVKQDHTAQNEELVEEAVAVDNDDGNAKKAKKAKKAKPAKEEKPAKTVNDGADENLFEAAQEDVEVHLEEVDKGMDEKKGKVKKVRGGKGKKKAKKVIAAKA